MRIVPLAILTLAVALLIVGCGGSSKTDVPPNITLLSEPALDGQVTATSTSPDQALAKIGDDASNQGMRAVVSFDLSSVPADAIVDSATLMIYQANEQEAQPATDTEPAKPLITFTGYPYNAVDASVNPGLGPVLVDHVYFGDNLTSTAYDMDALDLNIGTLASSWSLGYRQLDVTAQVVDDLNNRATRSHSQFRIRHTAVTNNNGAEDSDAWVMGEGQIPPNAPEGTEPNHKPGLVIIYHLPTAPG